MTTIRSLEERIEKLEKRLNEMQGINDDPIFDEVVKEVISLDEISPSYIQRKFNIGYYRSAKLIDELERRGYVSNGDYGMVRKVIKKSIDNPSILPPLSLISKKYDKESIPLRGLIENYNFLELEYKIPIILGVDENKSPIIIDLFKVRHLIIGGWTGSGKSLFTHNIITTLLLTKTPEEVRFIIVDPKQTIFSEYKNIPHLMTDIVTSTTNTIVALKWLLSEMEKRYKLLTHHNAKNLETYNNLEGVEKKPYIVFIVDEIANLMMDSPKEAEHSISNLASMSGVTGIHLILTSQRPVKDVFTKKIIEKIPSRILFNIDSEISSRLINTKDAEKLEGHGEFLYLQQDEKKPVKTQAPYISHDDIVKVTNHFHNK